MTRRLAPALATVCALAAARAYAAQVQTPDRANQSSAPNALATPLHDVNVLRQHIPPVLMAAVADPYAAPERLTCPRLGALVSELDRALGPDFNMPDTPQNPSLTQGNGHLALTLLSGATRILIPYDGLVRTVSGAQRHDQMVIQAITAGSVRRGYLKGLGEAYHCPPPALPAHRIDNPAPVAQAHGPAYPIR